MQALRLLSRRRRGQFRQAALWAMAPLALFNGWPAVGCICADGRFSSNCPMLQEVATGVDGESCCKAACCARPEDDAASKSCCQTAADSKQSKTDDETGCVVKHKGCCHVVVQSAVLPPLSEPTSIADGNLSWSPVGVSPWQFVGHLQAPSLARFVENDTGQHSSDLVITLRRLVI